MCMSRLKRADVVDRVAARLAHHHVHRMMVRLHIGRRMVTGHLVSLTCLTDLSLAMETAVSRVTGMHFMALMLSTVGAAMVVIGIHMVDTRGLASPQGMRS
jgi:hypothetical protein